MLGLLKKTMYIGLGCALITKDKAEDVVKDFIKRGDITEKEGKALISELIKKSEDSKNDIQAYALGLVGEAIDRVNYFTSLFSKADINDLKQDMQKLKELVKQSDKIAGSGVKDSPEKLENVIEKMKLPSRSEITQLKRELTTVKNQLKKIKEDA